MLAKQDEAIGTAVGRLKELSRDESLRMLAQWDEEVEAARGEAGRTKDEWKAGWKAGRRQQEEKFETAYRLLAMNLPLPTIQIATNLSQDEIMGLSFEGQRKH